MAPLAQAQKWMLSLIALGVPLSAWGALYPSNTWLQVGPVALMFPAAYLALRRWPVSNASAACMTAFVILHLFAARWSYSFVPYDDWTGGTISAAFGWERNHFDRLVHFAFGGVYEIFEWSLTLALAPEAAGAYNGEQGDVFDAQKDMALAGLGAALMVPLVRKASWWIQ